MMNASHREEVRNSQPLGSGSQGDPTNLSGTGGDWRTLYTVGAVAAVVTVLLIPVAIMAHVLWPPPPWAPGAAGDWFAYLQQNWIAGLLNLDLLLAVSLVLSIPFYLALYTVLRPTSPSATLIATAIALLSTMVHLVSITAFELLAFSQAHAAATTEMQRATYLAAGEAALAAYYGTAFQVSYLLGYVAYIIIGAVMLRSTIFSRATAYVGVLTGIAGFGFYLPTIGLFLSIVVVLLVAVWNILVARRLFQLGRRAAPIIRDQPALLA